MTELLRSSLRALLDGVRAVLLLRPRGNPARPTPAVFVAVLVCYALVSLLISACTSEPPRTLYAWGISTLLTDAMLTLIAAWLMVLISGRQDIVWGAAATTLAATTAISLLIQWPLDALAMRLFEDGRYIEATVLTHISTYWWLPALFTIARWLCPPRFGIRLAAALAAFAVSALPWNWIPAVPLIDQDYEALTPEEPIDGSYDGIVGSGFESDAAAISFDPERLMFEQPRLLDAAIATLKPRTAGKTNLFVLAFGGDGSENVFHNEVDYAKKLFSQRFDADGHVLVLDNNPASIENRPLASLTNLELAMQALAERMDPTEDILLVYLTSHGSKDHHLLTQLDPLPLNQILPEDIADALKTTPAIRWKVLIVNACYSGGFVESLHDDSTMVITSARTDRTSFGCGAESEITYFGRALMVDALNQTLSIPDAFAQAKSDVAARESEESIETPSEPQIASSRSIEAKLDAWSHGLPAHAPIPFEPEKIGNVK